MRVSIALTHHNRFDMLREAVAAVEADPRVEEVVISDDASDDGSWERIVAEYYALPKYRLFRNARNLDCYANKAKAVERCEGDWVVLFDSDNVMGRDYLDALEQAQPWLDRTAYLPTFARPEFDYRKFEGTRVDRRNVAPWVADDTFRTALNTANYLVRRDEYLRAWDPDTDPVTADSIYMNLRWLEQGNSLYFVPGLAYEHRIHPGSHFMTRHNRRHEEFKASVERRLRELR